jgi:hypothetical protein
MNLRRLINLALAVFVTVGLAAAPLTGPGAAAQSQAPGSMNMSMSSDMSCCPDQKSMDCQDCPLVAMCMLQTAQAGPSMAAALPLRYPVRTSHIVRNDVLAAGLDRPPPDQPPRSQV